jgi:hypothetical protein
LCILRFPHTPADLGPQSPRRLKTPRNSDDAGNASRSVEDLGSLDNYLATLGLSRKGERTADYTPKD